MRNKAAKGALFERELLRFLNAKGFSVMRAPSSGGRFYPVDVLAIKPNKTLAFECKNYKTKPKLDRKQLIAFKEWCVRAGAIGFLAWRTPESKWKFLSMKNAEDNSYEDENWIELKALARVFMF